MLEITKEKFIEVMVEEFTGVGNEWDDPEDEEEFKERLNGIWERLISEA